MRTYYNILLIPYILERSSNLKCCIFKREDMSVWQFIAGGGEDEEAPDQAAIREFIEESGIASNFLKVDKLVQLDSTASVLVDHFPELVKDAMKRDIFVIPIYTFAYDITEYQGALQPSDEHTEFTWVTFEEAQQLLHFDLDKTAICELQKRLSRRNK
ncbi:NUDIX domain-containing protein [Enterococcus mundtii]|uniref:NUDIX pyrophosphatase n=1 Tax=Enterococcus mundtii TaxID=53346 RepID=A0A2S7RNX1_ENTMU|nr:NUDIX domain-containing protein [Enterococcus mundtii]PQF20877.1 NUDIX pyrophosphatase [Enterococcus mundtii]PTO38499.1 NUDIX domain-containing protein [Enterococcus mundtii]PTO43690.1 NUDIX domain-containing protein [Enterococcus mundtii]